MATLPTSGDENLPNRQENNPADPKPELPARIVELLNVVPEPQRAQIISSLQQEIEVVVQESSMSMVQYQGPVPHPDTLKGMEEVVPGSAAQMIQMAVDQSKHRRECEKDVIGSQSRQSSVGQWLGFAIAVIALAISGYLINNGHDVAGGTLGTVDLVGLVSIFVIGKHQQRKDLDSKKD